MFTFKSPHGPEMYKWSKLSDQIDVLESGASVLRGDNQEIFLN